MVRVGWGVSLFQPAVNENLVQHPNNNISVIILDKWLLKIKDKLRNKEFLQLVNIKIENKLIIIDFL